MAQQLVRRMLATTGIVYYGTDTFTYPPIGQLIGAPIAALPPAGALGYDFMCLIKDLRKTQCYEIQVSVWSIMACVAAMVMVFCVVLIPVACIYHSGRFAGKSVNKMFKGNQPAYPEYDDIEARAAKASDGVMPMPKPSQYRSQYKKDDDNWDE